MYFEEMSETKNRLFCAGISPHIKRGDNLQALGNIALSN